MHQNDASSNFGMGSAPQVILCFLTSLASGYYPARLASKLDPIVALGRE